MAMDAGEALALLTELRTGIGPMPQTIKIGPDRDAPYITLQNFDFGRDPPVIDRAVDFSASQLVVDDFTATIHVTPRLVYSRGSSVYSIGGEFFHAAAGEAYLAKLGLPKDEIVAGYLDFITSGADMYLTAGGMSYRVPQTGDLYDAWEALWATVEYGTPVWYEAGGEVSLFYWKRWERVEKDAFRLTAQSAAGLLDGLTDYGGLFYRIPLVDRLHNLLDGIAAFSVDNALSDAILSGWQGVQSKRSALRQILAASGAVLLRDDSGGLLFTKPPDTAVEIPYGYVFMGGSVDRNDQNQYSRFEVTEHAFSKAADTEPVVLFDNTAAGEPIASEKRVVFDKAPVYELMWTEAGYSTAVPFTGEGNCNYAVISGWGVLTGTPYLHTTGVYALDGCADLPAENVCSLTDNALVSVLNSAAIAQRLRAWYHAGPKITMDFVRTGQAQKPGALVSFTDPYGTFRTGYITALRSRATSFDRSAATVLCSYTPPGGGSFSRRFFTAETMSLDTNKLLDGAESAEVLAVLIGGGDGGSSGRRGPNYDDTIQGGGAGTPGAGGKIYAVRFTIYADGWLTLICGAGGAGGIAPRDDASEQLDPDDDTRTYVSTPGSPGGNTYISNDAYGETYNSASGRSYATGYTDMLSKDGATYGMPGPGNGQPGGEAAHMDGSKYIQPSLAVSWLSGIWYAGPRGSDAWDPTSDITGTGGFGGGAAVGYNGWSGGTAIVGPHSSIGAQGGAGGAGHDAKDSFPEDSRTFGTGGSGGHGGGAGGQGGSGRITFDNGDSWETANGANGSGGYGSNGQDGRGGCILIYY